MENPPQQAKRTGISIFAALSGMVLAFLVGVFVGLHPSWIPIETSSYPDVSKPVVLPENSPLPATQPQTQAAEASN